MIRVGADRQILSERTQVHPDIDRRHPPGCRSSACGNKPALEGAPVQRISRIGPYFCSSIPQDK